MYVIGELQVGAYTFCDNIIILFNCHYLRNQVISLAIKCFPQIIRFENAIILSFIIFKNHWNF